MMIVALFLGSLLSGAVTMRTEAKEQPIRVVRHEMPKPEVVGDRAELPLQFEHGLPVFIMTLGGEKLRFGFDTGAVGGPHLILRVPASLKLSPIGEAYAGDPSGKNLVPIKLYRLPTAQLGSITVREWIATATPQVSAKLDTLDGVVGLGAFDGFVVTLDYPGHRLVIERGSLPAPDGRMIFDYDASDLVPSVPVTLEGRTLQAHVDTGNVAFPLIIPADAAQRLSHFKDARTIGVAHTISSAIEIKAVRLDSDAFVGAVPLAVREVGYPSVINRGNIGSLALSGAIIRIDPKNHRIEISSAPGSS